MSPKVSEKEFIERYNEYYDRIYNYILRNVYNRETAEDLTSQTFLKALKSIRETDPDIRNFNAWLYKIATNEVLMHHRSKRVKKTVSFDVMEEDGVQFAGTHPHQADHTKFIALEQALVRLTPSEKMIIELSVFENKSYAEISSILQVPEPSLRARMCRAVKRLKELLGD